MNLEWLNEEYREGVLVLRFDSENRETYFTASAVECEREPCAFCDLCGKWYWNDASDGLVIICHAPMETTKLTDRQISNWRMVLLGMIGPYALIMSPEEITAIRDNIQERANQIAMEEK